MWEDNDLEGKTLNCKLIALAFSAAGKERFRVFESFVPLSLSAKTIYDAHAAKIQDALPSPSYFQSLYAWNFTAKSEYNVFCGYLCIVTRDSVYGDIFALPPIGSYDPGTFSEAIDVMYGKFAGIGIDCVFQEVPGFMLPYFSSLARYDVYVSHDENWSDYVFAREDFIEGITKRSSREAIRNFEKKYCPLVREMSSSDMDETVLITERHYCRDRICSDCFCGCEVKVISRLLKDYETLGLSGIVVETCDGPVAFGIVCFQKDFMYFISKKVKRGVRGLNEYLNLELMNRFGGNCKYVNYSDDMGNEGLRFYKSRLGRHSLSHRHVVRLTIRNAGGAP
jgi:hypothetical protein